MLAKAGNQGLQWILEGVAKGLKPGTGSGGIACIMTENSRISQTLVVNSSIIAVDSEGVPALKDLLT